MVIDIFNLGLPKVNNIRFWVFGIRVGSGLKPILVWIFQFVGFYTHLGFACISIRFRFGSYCF